MAVRYKPLLLAFHKPFAGLYKYQSVFQQYFVGLSREEFGAGKSAWQHL